VRARLRVVWGWVEGWRVRSGGWIGEGEVEDSLELSGGLEDEI
jgi:hypothetical protein